MKKLILIFALIISNQFCWSQTVNTIEDHPGEAVEFDIELTKDPSTGQVPKEHLIPIMNTISQQFAATAGAPVVANWFERGPNNVGGRTRALMFDPNDATNKKVWAGAADGGLWVCNDITLTTPVWTNVSSLWANLSVSTLAYTPSNTQVFYAGTGEGWYNADAVRGMGIWKTSNGGTSWSQLSSTMNDNFYCVQKIIIHPTSGAVLATTRGPYCNSGTGIFRSTDGGTSWTKVFGTSGTTCPTSNAGGADLELGADGTLYASTGLSYTGGIYKSTDGGLTWISIGGNGFPTSGYERIEIAVAQSDANRLYAMVESSSTTNALLGIYTSINKGASWTACTLPTWVDNNCSVTSSDMTRGQAWYDMIIAVDPLNASTLLIGGVDIFKSTNAGSTWTQLSSWWGGCSRPYIHADQHAILFKPGTSSTAIFGNDGGVYYSSNVNTTSPSFQSKNNGYNVTQFYSCALHPSCGQNYFIGGTQDNGTHRFSNPGINSTTQVYGGDGAFCFIDQTNPSIQISSYVYNNYYRTTDNWTTTTQISSSDNTIGSFINPADYDDKNHILYSSYSSTQLSRVSGIANTTPDLPFQFTVSGMTDKASHIRVSPYAPIGTTTLFVGTKNGQLFKVTNAQGTATTTNISGTVAPWNTTANISCVEIGASENDLLVTFSNYGVISVWRTTNGGLTWSNKEGNLQDMPVRWAIYNPNDLNEVFLATELGIWSTSDINATSPIWVANNTNFANVRVDMLQYRNSDKELIAATHGRGIFSTSSLNPGSKPQSDFNANSTNVCEGAPIMFSDQSCSNPTSWSWTFTGGTPSTSTLQNPVITYNTAGTYSVTLTATNANGSHTTTKTNFITITASPAISTSATLTSLCSGNSTSITASGYTSYTWSPGTLSGSTIVVSPLATTTYTVTGTNAAGCTKSTTRLITVNTTPTVGTTASATTICAGSSTSITGTGASTYVWNPGALSGTTITVSPATSTTYTVVGTNASGCTNSSTRFITVNSQPTIGTTATATTICAGTSTTLNGNGASTYVWNPGALSGTSITVSPATSTTYTVVGTNSLGCTNSSTRLITVNNLPTVGTTASATTICAGLSTSITGTGATSYTWNPGALSGTAISVSPLITTTYTVVGSNVSGCTNTSTRLITVNPSPTTAVTASSSTICPGTSTTLSATGASTYSWQPGSLSGANVVVSPTTNTIYTVTGTNTNACTKTATKLISVNTSGNTSTSTNVTEVLSYYWPVNGLTYTASGTYTKTSTNANGCVHTDMLILNIIHFYLMIDQDISCYGNNDGSVITSLAGSIIFTTYTLDNTISNSTGIFSGLAPGIHTVCATNGSIIECATVEFTDPPPMIADIISTTPVTCSGADGTLLGDATGGNTGIYDFYWKNASNVIIGYNSYINNLSAGTYILQVVDASGCIDTAMVTLTPPTNCGSVVNLTCYIQGYWTDANMMTSVLANQGRPTTSGVCDTIIVELHKSTAPFNTLYSIKTRLFQNGTAQCNFPVSSGTYYIVVKHRNALQTWSAAPITLSTTPIFYNFSTAANKAYGSNQILIDPGVYGFYSGDINGDENIDLLDLSMEEADINNFLFGYYNTDLNGDGNIDLLDSPMLESNINNFIFSVHP